MCAVLKSNLLVSSRWWHKKWRMQRCNIKQKLDTCVVALMFGQLQQVLLKVLFVVRSLVQGDLHTWLVGSQGW